MTHHAPDPDEATLADRYDPTPPQRTGRAQAPVCWTHTPAACDCLTPAGDDR